MTDRLQIKNAMILAAGFGKRLQSVIGDLPKPLVDLGGMTALEISINGLNQVKEIENIYINVHWQYKKIKDFLHSIKINKNIYVIEEETILETGGGIFNVMRKINGDHLLIKNSDVVFLGNENIYQNLIEEYAVRGFPNALLILVGKKQNTNGDFCIGERNYIFRDSENNYIYTGCGILSKQMFAMIKKVSPFPLSNLLFLANRNNYKKYQYSGFLLPTNIKWFDIGTPESLILARAAISKNQAI